MDDSIERIIIFIAGFGMGAIGSSILFGLFSHYFLRWFNKENEWISVDDRLPERDVEVLVYASDGLVYLAWIDFKWDWVAEESTKIVAGVTHWFPVPDLPE